MTASVYCAALLFCLSFLVVFIAPVTAQQADPTLEFFETRIRPVLVGNCFSCHTDNEMGELRLDSRSRVLKGGKSGPAVVPGKPEESLLIRAVRQVGELKMPMEGRLSQQEVADLTAWVQMGVPWPEEPPSITKTEPGKITPEDKAYWAFRAIRRPAVPEIGEVDDSNWPKSGIDRFVLSRLEAEGLEPAPPAEKRVLIRRAYFDLIGIPPTPKQVDDFLRDRSTEAFARVIDRLLALPHYGERWGRHWLDVARYGEEDARGLSQEYYPNAFRYRDWVVSALNQDMPYDLFVKAQIAGDLIEPQDGEPDQEALIPALGFFGLGPWYYDVTVPRQARSDERHDRVDVLTRGFLGLTVACARCHDHKFDPITMNDYYGLAGVFSSSQYREYPLAPAHEVEAFHRQERKVKEQETAILEFVQTESAQLGTILARKTAPYLVATWKALNREVDGTADKSSDREAIALQEHLDREVLARWVRYLRVPEKDHPYLDEWNALVRRGATLPQIEELALTFQQTVLSIIEEKKEIDAGNRIILERNRPPKDAAKTFLPNGFSTYEEFCPGCQTSVESLERDKFVLWSDLLGPPVDAADPSERQGAVLLFQDGEGNDKTGGKELERFLGSEWRSHLESMRAQLENLKKGLPERYPFLHALAESDHPSDIQLHLRGSPFNLGKKVPRRLLEVLSRNEPVSFVEGSGRRELAEAIARHPLTARVIVNRIWQHHFGQGIVATPSNFGRLGERPTHPHLLEYLAAKLIDSGFSIKSLHRQIMLSAVYQSSSEYSKENFAKDPENRWLWRTNRRRLDVEALRDSMLFVSGTLDPRIGGPTEDWDETNHRRTIYGKVSRFKLDHTLALFDYPSPAITSEQRNVTHVPLQKLFFLNSDWVIGQAAALAKRLHSDGLSSDEARLREAYLHLFSREAADPELQLGLEFLQKAAGRDGAELAWQQYAQVLLSSNEFSFVD